MEAVDTSLKIYNILDPSYSNLSQWPTQLFWQFLTIGMLYFQKIFMAQLGGMQEQGRSNCTIAQKQMVIYWYLTKCWNSGLPQYSPTMVLPIRHLLSYEISSWLFFYRMENQASAISLAKEYLYPVYNSISLLSLTNMDTFFEAIIHSSNVLLKDTCAFYPLALLSRQTWTFALAPSGTFLFSDNTVQISSKTVLWFCRLFLLISLMFPSLMALSEDWLMSKNFIKPLLAISVCLLTLWTSRVLPRRMLFLQNGYRTQIQSSWGPLVLRLKSMIIQSLLMGCRFCTDLNDFLFFSTTAQSQLPSVYISLLGPKTRYYSFLSALEQRLLGSWAYYSEFAFMIQNIVQKNREQKNSVAHLPKSIRLSMKLASERILYAYLPLLVSIFLLVITKSGFTVGRRKSAIPRAVALHFLMMFQSEEEPITESKSTIFLPSMLEVFILHFIQQFLRKSTLISAVGSFSKAWMILSETIILGSDSIASMASTLLCQLMTHTKFLISLPQTSIDCKPKLSLASLICCTF